VRRKKKHRDANLAHTENHGSLHASKGWNKKPTGEQSGVSENYPLTSVLRRERGARKRENPGTTGDPLSRIEGQKMPFKSARKCKKRRVQLRRKLGHKTEH